MVQALGSLSHGRVMQIAKPSLAEVPGPDEGKASLCTLPNAGLLQGEGTLRGTIVSSLFHVWNRFVFKGRRASIGMVPAHLESGAFSAVSS